MTESLKMLRSIVKEEINNILSEGLKSGDHVDTNEKFDMIKPGDSIEIDGVPCTVVKFDDLYGDLIYVESGKSVRKSIDTRYAVAWEADETPETEVIWKGKGKAPAKTRSAPRKKTPRSWYD